MTEEHTIARHVIVDHRAHTVTIDGVILAHYVEPNIMVDASSNQVSSVTLSLYADHVTVRSQSYKTSVAEAEADVVEAQAGLLSSAESAATHLAATQDALTRARREANHWAYDNQ